MKRLVLAAMLAIVVALPSCGSSTTESTTSAASSAPTSDATSETSTASGCSGSGLDAMTALSDFQLEMDAAQKEGTLTLDQLTAARDTLFNETQAAAEKEDWTAYCKSIDDMRTELGL
jgi:FlaG/FlaF family flagellin (archaellin)